ncbi:MAG: sulfatase, partial [Candidatus Omnitrophica bacterium]|nr:sulfatase [Candidatus Omnitrophota bacterium]
MPEQGAYKDYNVIIFLIDALRYDHLGCYGYKRDTSPNIDALSQQSLVFTNVVAQATWTKPSVVSLFTSKYVKDHGVVSDRGIDISSNLCPNCTAGDTLAPDTLTLTEILKANGYKTKALINNGVLNRKFGLEQGFDEYTASGAEPKQTQRAMNWIKTHKDSKFFMYLHYLAPHAPYDPPPEYRKKFKLEYNGKFDFRGKTHYDYVDVRLSPEETDELMARYDGEISYVDHEFGRFVEFLREQNILQKTLLIIVADHGEALGERGPIGHGYAFNTVAQVPLIVFPAPEHRRQTMNNFMGLIDVAPSILGWLGIAVPPDFKGNDVMDSRNK